MKLSESINEALCGQCSHELLNMWKYSVIASYFEDMRLPNLAKKFYSQSDEEHGHFLKILKYINQRLGGKYTPVEIQKPNLSINSPKEVGEIYLETEKGTTQSLQEISEMIYDEKSNIDIPFIEEMLVFQIAEEEEADEFLKKISTVSDIVIFDATLED